MKLIKGFDLEISENSISHGKISVQNLLVSSAIHQVSHECTSSKEAYSSKYV